MTHAVIDLGSNSVRLSIYECQGTRIQKTFDEKQIAGLSSYVTDDVLETAGIERACVALNHLKGIASKFAAPDNIHLFASASLRNVRNRDEAVHMIARETALIPDVLEGDEEAALGFVGVSKLVDCDSGIMIDIGGASTELVLFQGGKAVNLVSLPMGCLNLSVKYVGEIIPNGPERRRIKEVIRAQLSKVDWGKKERYPLLVGTGGTLRAALKLSHALLDLPATEHKMPAGHIKRITKLLRKNENNIFLMVYKAVPERLMTISTGLMILQEAIERFGCKTLSVSHFGVREGYLVGKILSMEDDYVINAGI